MYELFDVLNIKIFWDFIIYIKYYVCVYKILCVCLKNKILK